MSHFFLFLRYHVSIFTSGRAPSSGGDAETMVNGDETDSKKLDTIVITGKADNCEAAKNALLVSLFTCIIPGFYTYY